MINVPTYEELLDRCLSKVPDEIYKGEGTLIYDAIAPACFELVQVYLELQNVLNLTYVDTSFGDFLTKRCSERGVYRGQATNAIRKGVFNVEVPIGKRFAFEDTTYQVIKHLVGFEYELKCEQLGRVGNIYSGWLIPLDNIEGLTSAMLSDIIIPGEDIEDDEKLRKRYFSSIENESFGGNIADYKQRTNQIKGIGGTKVYPTWNGGGTVKLVVINSEYKKPNNELINQVQTLIDPTQNQGKGVGIAPIGHVVTVQPVDEMVVNVESNITLLDTHTWEDVKPYIDKAIDEYLIQLSSTWENAENIVVRIAHIETRILQVTGVLDVQFTKINSSLNNLILQPNSIPKLGAVTKV
ncbi:baseplate J/gp47 family protein [Niameybacter massiliensis]|uniref:baseplate J/gp47 family protein n=1 Tax=Niameybacter massiliensis TaxID=1658108 RepID=UPI0006B683CD|nr:baseplate J/gp47 family protein [Niameybacter massiliensis]